MTGPSSCRTNWNTLTLKPTLHKLIHLHKINSFMQKQTLQVSAEISMKTVVVPEGVPKHFVPVGQPWMPQNPHRKGSQNTCQMHGIHQSKEPQYYCSTSFHRKFINWHFLKAAPFDQKVKIIATQVWVKHISYNWNTTIIPSAESSLTLQYQGFCHLLPATASSSVVDFQSATNK